ncbi:hypothetical protein BDN71DRAFT_560224 [Pleurotus eryngii]|uniref:Uncharacterized protein n=1 Tax=Pleurotus eryngii TaxID=5323 RepID=A0A9P6DH98_PLEER|nr:hypothetical protein BDN71DRAFT_560224 [Pleurotus eryngii]
MDFWESLEGQLVTIPKPVALDFPNSFGEIWVPGDWAVTGLSSRGGLTITLGRDLPTLLKTRIMLVSSFQIGFQDLMAIQTQILRQSSSEGLWMVLGI